MKKLLCNSLIASVVAVAGAAGFAGEAKAQSVPVDFSGNVGNACEIEKISDGVVGLTDTLSREDVLSSRPDEASVGQLGEVAVTCNDSGNVTVSPLTAQSADATNLLNQAGSVKIAELYSEASAQNSLANSSVPESQATVTSDGNPISLYVHALVRTGDATPVPAGNYTFRTTVTVTPQ